MHFFARDTGSGSSPDHKPRKTSPKSSVSSGKDSGQRRGRHFGRFFITFFLTLLVAQFFLGSLQPQTISYSRFVQEVRERVHTLAPFLRLVVVMQGDELSYGESFEEALQGLFGEGERVQAPSRAPTAGGAPAQGLRQLADRADRADRAAEAFRTYLRELGEKDFGAAATALEPLSEALTAMEQQTEASDGGSN